MLNVVLDTVRNEIIKTGLILKIVTFLIFLLLFHFTLYKQISDYKDYVITEALTQLVVITLLHMPLSVVEFLRKYHGCPQSYLP